MAKCFACGTFASGRHTTDENLMVDLCLLSCYPSLVIQKTGNLIYIYILNRIYYDAAKQLYGKTCEEERQARPVGSGQSQSLRALPTNTTHAIYTATRTAGIPRKYAFYIDFYNNFVFDK